MPQRIRLRLSFSIVPGDFCVARLDPLEPIPEWTQTGRFLAITRTEEELSIVCTETSVPKGVRAEPGWALLKLAGPFAFDQIGILVSFARPLAEAGVSLFAISTFDTDYLLVKRHRLPDALAALAAAGHERVGG